MIIRFSKNFTTPVLIVLLVSQTPPSGLRSIVAIVHFKWYRKTIKQRRRWEMSTRPTTDRRPFDLTLVLSTSLSCVTQTHKRTHAHNILFSVRDAGSRARSLITVSLKVPVIESITDGHTQARPFELVPWPLLIHNFWIWHPYTAPNALTHSSLH